MLKMLAAVAVASVSIAAGAAQIVLTPTDVIASSGSYADPQFAASNILDDQTGVITEPTQANYWLNPDNGPANAFITIDLHGRYSHLSFELYNTHNGGYQDRGTGNFTLTSGATTLVSGTLAPEHAGAQPLTAQSFTATDTGKFRYITFNPTSVAVGGSPCCGANNYGLNEIRVFGTAVLPEPASWALMVTGFGLVGVATRRRHVATA